ncbi:hypothetical protein [Microbacterium sp. 77mftsu3.1]|uniref:hypothetical protein n=1 Tax=Microbacterium sp. 77mftsu3.1 TaxID=1761802 RepID=UPI0003623072|nr:hypothetical protein [Microbacterium sp. 77mftsu3.1]SDH34385.1 hypothetical protein SAMN04488590_3083 [Microbacterium sp. 77mftsu3.1]
MPEETTAPAAYDLTSFTGRKKNAERVFFVRNYELNLFTSYVIGASLVVSLPVTAALWAIIAMFLPAYALASLVAPVICVAAGLYLIDQRSKRGLQLRNYRAILDRRSAEEEKRTLYICGQPIPKPQVSFFTPQYVLAAPVESLSAPDGHPVNGGSGKASTAHA